MRLANKLAVVTGAGSGIGRRTAIRFAEEGGAVCVVDIDAKGREGPVKQILSAGGPAFFRQCNVSKESETKV